VTKRGCKGIIIFSSPMASQSDDRWLWLGLGVFFFFAAQGIRHAIGDMVRLIELPPEEEEPPARAQDGPHAAVALQDLKVLAMSPSPNISNTAITMIADRVSQHPGLWRTITEESKSPNERIRQRALRTIRFLDDWTMNSPFPAMRGGRDIPPIPARDPEWGGESRGIVSSLEDIGAAADLFAPGAAAPSAGWDRVPSERPPATHSADEAARRRSRREAMVLHEGDGRINESDIISRVAERP